MSHLLVIKVLIILWYKESRTAREVRSSLSTVMQLQSARDTVV